MKTSIRNNDFNINQINYVWEKQENMNFWKENNDLARFYELSSDLFCISGFDGYLKKVNPAFSQSLGYSEQELLSKPLTHFVMAEDVDKTEDYFRSIMQGADFKYYENRYICKNGNIKWLSWRFFVVPEELLIYAIARDITEEKTVQIAMVKQTKILESLVLYKNEGLKYAGFLQEAIFQDPESIKNIFPQSFILYSPKDIIGGDFYWFEKLGKRIFLACGDCTGHGVPGAMLTVLGLSKINSIITSPSSRPGEILEILNSYMYNALGKRNSNKRMKDGMDMALFSIDADSLLLSYSGARIPLYIVRNGELIELEGDKISVGESISASPFGNKTLQLKKNDMIYTFSDGYADQFGGPKEKKFTKKRFKELLTSIADKNSEEQKALLKNAISNWMEGHDQTDDTLVMGIRI
jgi:PAS domain S-box-containing protein